MRLLVTGASGWIGSASVTALMDAGHQVVGLARSDAGAARIAALGAEVAHGTLEDVAGLRAAAERTEGVVHLGYNHDFSRMDAAAATDRVAIEAFAEVLRGTGGPLLIASGVLGLLPGGIGTERDMPSSEAHPRIANAAYTLDLAKRGVRSIVMRFAPTVHGSGGDHGFVATLARIARQRGVSAYIGDGLNRWPAVHRLDAARLIQLAVEKAPAGTVLHAVSEEGIRTCEIAAAIGRSLGLPVESVLPDRTVAHFDWIGRFFGVDSPASSELTRQLLGWTPTQPGLLADIADGHYPGL
jgi:nucleoside-diphosphate-sugar epimerase